MANEIGAAAVMGPNDIPTTSSFSSQINRKDMTPEAWAAYQASLAANQGTVQALANTGAPMPDVATPESVNAELQSRANSEVALNKNLVRNAPDPFAPPVEVGQTMEPPGRELAPKTSQEFNASPEIKGPQDVAAATDEANRYKAVAAAREQAHLMAEQQRLQVERNARLQQNYQETLRRADEYQRAAKGMTSFWEDKSVPQKILLGLAMGRPNGQEMIQSAITQDTELKRAKLNALMEQHRLAGASDQQLIQFYDEAQRNLLANNIAKVKAIDLTAQTMLARYPQAQQSAKVLLADKIAATQKEAFDQLAAHTDIDTQGAHTTTVTGQGMGARGIPPTKDTIDYTQAQEMGAKAARMRELAKLGQVPTPEENNAITDNQMAIAARMEKEKGSLGEAKFGKILRWADLAPDQIYPKGISEAKKEYHTLRGQLAENRAINVAGTGFMSNPITYLDVIGKLSAQRNESAPLTAVKDEGLMSFAENAAKNTREVSKVGRSEQRLGVPLDSGKMTEADRAAMAQAIQVIANQSKESPARIAKARAVSAGLKAKYGAQ